MPMLAPNDKPDALWTLITQRCREDAQAIAFIDGEQRISCQAFCDLCERTTAWLLAQGVQPGDRVAVWLVNRLEWLALLFGLARLGAILVAVNTRFRSEEITQLLAKSGTRFLVLQQYFRSIDFAAILDGVSASALPTLERLFIVTDGTSPLLTLPSMLLGRPVRRFAPTASALPELAADPQQPVILFTTSGTTKGPKLVMHPQRTIRGHAHDCARAFGLDQPDSVMLAMVPWCGVYGLMTALSAFAGGAPIVLMDSFDAPSAVRLLKRHAVTHAFGSDEIFNRIMEATAEPRPFPAARCFGFGAFTSSFTAQALRAWQRGMPLVGMYGSSEVLSLFAAQPISLPVEQRIEGGGRPVCPTAKVRIRDTQDPTCLLPPGRSGEIEINAPSNFIGYFGDAQATASVMREDGFFRTGDLGHLREDGSFVFETRMGDAIRLGGFLVNPVDIETVLKQLDGVGDAQIAAVEIDGALRVVAFVIRATGSTVDATVLIEQMRTRVAPFKVPTRLWFVDGYPVTHSANGVKTQRNKLREMALTRLAEEP